MNGEERVRRTQDDGAVRGATLAGQLRLAWDYVISSVRKDRRAFYVGLATVTIVVAFTAVLQSAVVSSPVIFLKLAEDTAGEGDVILLPGTSSSSPTPSGSAPAAASSAFLPLINTTDVGERLRDDPTVRGIAPRWLIPGKALNTELVVRNTSAFILLLDSQQEYDIGIGRSWNRRALGPLECYATESALEEIGVRGSRGERVTVLLDPFASLNLAVGGGGGGGAGLEVLLQQFLLNAFASDQPDLVEVNVDDAIAVLVDQFGLEDQINVDNLPPLGTVTVNRTQVLLTLVSQSSLLTSATFQREFTVVESIPAPNGKWTAALGNVVMLEAPEAAVWIREDLMDQLNGLQNTLEPVLQILALEDAFSAAKEAVEGFDYETMKAFSQQVIIQSASSPDLYVEDSNHVEERITAFADSVADSLGYDYPATYTTPLATAMGSTRFIKMFLDQIFNDVIFVLSLLAIMVVYALVLGDVEEKTYEYGMLRALGMPHFTLAELLTLRTAIFAVPGIALGLFLASLLHLGVVAAVEWFAGASIAPVMKGTAWLYGGLLGAIVPLVANIIPIRRALGSNLRDALDLYHQTFSDVTVRFQKLADWGLSLPQTVLALLLTLLGFVTFYLMPLSFATGQFSNFLTLLNAVLMGMVLGLVLIAQTLQSSVERLVLRLFMWGETSKLHTVVRKNMAGHRSRNQKTAFMVSLSIGFLLFAGAMFALQSASIQSNIRLFVGADILVIAPDRLNRFSPRPGNASLPEEELTTVMQALQAPLEGDERRGIPARPALVRDFTFVSYPVAQIDPAVQSGAGNLINVPFEVTAVRGIEENYLHVAYEEFAVPTETVGFEGGEDVVEALFRGAGDLRLPVESLLDDNTPPPATIGFEGDPMYTCPPCNSSSSNSSCPSGEVTWDRCRESCPDPDACEEAVLVTQEEREVAVRAAYKEYVAILMTEAYRGAMQASTDTPMDLRWISVSSDLKYGAVSERLAKARAMVKKMPGFFFSPYRQTAGISPVLVRMVDVDRVLGIGRSDLARAIAEGTALSGGFDLEEESDGPSDTEPLPSAPDESEANEVRDGAGPTSWEWGREGWGERTSSSPQNGSRIVDALDANFSTALVLDIGGEVGVAWLALDVGACRAVEGAAVWGDGSPQAPREWQLEAATGVSGPWQRVGGARDEGAGWSNATVARTSARFWRIVVNKTESTAWDDFFAGRVTLTDIALDISGQATVASECDFPTGGRYDTLGVPKQRMLVRLMPGIGSSGRRAVVNAIRNPLPDDSFQVQDTASLLQSTESAQLGIEIFFDFVAALALVLCFFASWLSFEANIRENSRELGILRSLGLRREQVEKVYLLEALAVVMASFLLGMGIGLLIAITLTLQFNLFTQMPFDFQFPTSLFIISLFLTFTVALLSSYLPVRSLARLPISSVVKGRRQ